MRVVDRAQIDNEQSVEIIGKLRLYIRDKVAEAVASGLRLANSSAS